MKFLHQLMILLVANHTAAQTCVPLQNDTALNSKRLDQYQISHLLGFKLERCVLECLLVKMCKSFNYKEAAGVCELNSVNLEQVGNSTLQDKTEFEYHDILDWNAERAGTCASRPCAENQRCLQTTPYMCVDIDCGLPPAYTESYPPLRFNILPTVTLTSLGTRVWYYCAGIWATLTYKISHESPFLNSSRKICNSDLKWSRNLPKCISELRDCAAIKECNPNYGDGHYWIYKFGIFSSRVKVYCHDMADTTKTYITLLNSNNIAYDAGNGSGPTWTVFSKIRIDRMFNIDSSDFAFATSHGPNGNIPFGEAASCLTENGAKVYGYFNIDTSGTETMVRSKQNTWTTIPSTGTELVNLSQVRFVTSGYCWGTCGRCAPQGNLILTLQDTDEIDVHDTVHPTCI